MIEGLGSEYMATPCRLNVELQCVRVPGFGGYTGLRYILQGFVMAGLGAWGGLRTLTPSKP